ncbi:MAG: signal transduction histidine kinase [Verrucomicrobiales bacterium]|jgi:signal transduction histidine kinase
MIAGVLSYLHQREFLRAEIESEASRDLILDMSRLQAVMGRMIRRNELNLVQNQMSTFGSDPYGELAVVIDDSHMVIAAARRDRIQQLLADALPSGLQNVPFFSSDSFAEVARSMTGFQEVLNDGHIVGISPLALAAQDGELRPSRVGFLILVRNLGPLQQNALMGARRQAWEFGASLAVFAILFGVLLHFAMTKRILRIAEAARDLGAGDFEARSHIRGKDEIGLLGEAFDRMVTQRAEQVRLIRENEEHLRQLNEELEERVRERTAKLEQAHEELVQAEKLSTLGQLSGGVAHELRTPMGVIGNAVYFLRATLKDPAPDIAGAMAEIDRALASSDHIISELLDYARSPQTTELRTFPLDQTIEEALQDVEIPASIAVDRQGDHDLNGKGQAGQIHRILINLIRNAVQAMPDGGRLLLRTHNGADEVAVEVEDSGPGIEEEQLAKIFEPLYSQKTMGIGLGLAISQRYAEMNEGRLEVANSPSRGAAFRLTLKRG